ncbi:MAG: FAD-dependent oxidoreductase [Bacillota bacterium]|nr:FAD-dependent oxidoreductase [Bacillota bacterium]
MRKQWLAILVALVLLSGIPVMAQEAVVEGQGTGMRGAIVVEMTFDGSRIASMAVKEHQETYGIGYGLAETPIEVLPAEIVESQSLAVDMVSGATITCASIIRAATEAIKAAGLDPADYEATIPASAAADRTLEADVVVAGAGAAGLSAGIEALSNGASVIVLEKQGITGGATARCGGKFLAAGTSWQQAQGYEDDPELMFEYLKEVGGDKLDDDKVRDFCEHSVETLTWIEEMGVKMQDVEAIHSSLTPWRVHNVVGAGGMTDGHGGQFTVPLTQRFETLGGQIVYQATADAIVTDESGKACGLTALMADGSRVTVKANAVILATGGYAQNRALLDFPAVQGYHTSVPTGNVGDGLTMAEAVGASVYVPDYTQVVYVSFTCGVGINEEAGLIVNDQGVRCANEYTYQYHVSDSVARTGSSAAYYIADANDPNPTVQYGMTLDSTPRADSVEALAESIGMQPEALAATVARYNELCEHGEDKDFGKPTDKMIALAGPTFYAIKMSPCVTVTYGGLNINRNAQVLTDGGAPIDGLYAAGEVAFTGLFGTEYPCCGMAVGSAVYFGRVAGAQAATAE